MSVRENISLFDYCVYAQRLGSSRALAWASWHRYGGETRRREFDRAWKAAQAAERLAATVPGLMRMRP